MADLLIDTSTTGEQYEMINIMRESGRLLLIIINDILNYSKLEAHKVDLEKSSFSLHEILRNIEALMKPLIAARNITLVTTIDAPARVIGDAGRVQQIIFNLVGNSVKFTEEGTVTILIGILPPKSSRSHFISIKVIDTGMGMSQETQSRLFQPFMQADTSTTRRWVNVTLNTIHNIL